MTKVINKYEFNSKLFSIKENKKMTNDDKIEDKEEYLVIKAIKIQHAKKSKPS